MGNVATIALVAVAIFIVLWTLRSTPAQGQKVLQRWGIAKPTEEQGELAAIYLRQRRNLYPYVAIAVLGLAFVGEWLFSTGASTRWEGILLFSIVASLLVAELLATMRRPSDRTRSAVLAPRRFTDIVPRFGLVTLGLLVIQVVGIAAVTFAALPFSDAMNAWRARHRSEAENIGTVASDMVDTSRGPLWIILLTLAICVVASLAVVRLCQVRGPITTDLAVDAALRIRSGRVALGTAVLLGVGFVGSANAIWSSSSDDAHVAPNLTGPASADLPAVPDWMLPLDTWIERLNLVGFLCLFVWVVLISPWRTQRLVAAHV